MNGYYRPQTRGELRDKLKEGVQCEVVTDSVAFTKIALAGWLDFDAFTIHPSENTGWMVFSPNKPAQPDN